MGSGARTVAGGVPPTRDGGEMRGAICFVVTVLVKQNKNKSGREERRRGAEEEEE